MRYTEIGRVGYSSYDQDGRRIDEADTVELKREGLFGEAVHRMAASLARPGREWVNIPRLLMTTEACWSGYSEYTVSNQWSEIVLTIPDWNWEQSWASLGLFLRAVAEANPEEER